MAESKLTSALIAALEDPKAAEARLREAAREQEQIETPDDAELIVRLLQQFPLPTGSSAKRTFGSPLNVALGWMQVAKDKEVVRVFRELGGPELLRIFDTAIAAATTEKETSDTPGKATLSGKNDLLFLLKVVCWYTPEGGLERLVTAARSPLLKDGFLWSTIFQMVSRENHPWQTASVEALRDPLPDGFIGIAYLDLSNDVARSGKLTQHPFATEEGLALLQGWLLDEENSSYAHSAAASIPFLPPEARAQIQPLADRHPDRNVQLEAAWAAAACGEERGYQILQAACATPQEAAAAMHYLTELGAEDRIPLQCKTDDFEAISEMCRWLAHPTEMGSPPQAIHQVDARELFWPPTNDRRKLWVFRYEYEPDEDEDETEPETGYAMVGSVTFALFGEATSDLTAEQVYGLHCAWELECKGDPRAPGKRTAEAGMQILREHNPGFGQG